jgi:class 3 adenylate cyclase/tetratricopeptide (TPR) repeat protein
MKCPRCQHENEPGAKFCEECATPLARACPGCGRPLSPTAKFCPECAHPTGLAVPLPPVERFHSPESYTPKHLAEKILTSKSALEGERKQVTVLFADLKGSLELLADRDPEEARKLLDPVLERMMEAVHRYEGTVNQVMGDGIMALFGAPVAHEDHSVRACYAAIDMQAAIRRYSDEVWRSHGVKAQIRVGLNSGEVVVRAIGSDLRLDYSAIGQTTHLAARMEQLATPGTTLVTGDTLRLAEGYVTATPMGPVPVRGLETAIEVYELTGARPRRSRLHAAAARGLTPFVGREGELDQLQQALSRAGGGQGQVVAIVGEPGVGKSRLVWEVTHSHRVHGWLVLQAGSVSYGRATSYLPVIDLLKSYFAIEDRDGPRVVQEKLTGKLLTLDRALEGTLPALLSLLEVPTDDPQWPMLDPLQRRRHTLDAVKRLFLRESQVQPLLVVVEDLHWIDSETQALLDEVVESLPAARLLLLVNYRPEYRRPWGTRTSYTQVRLDPLPRETAEQLLGALLGSDAALDPLQGALIARTEGNPFFLEESVRALVETGALRGQRGTYRPARPRPTVQVPATVQAVLAARIDRLAPGDKALLQTASVVGKDVPFALLQAITEPSQDELHSAIGRLQAAEFLYEAALFPDLEYSFTHALTHDVAYGSLLQDQRRALHGQIVEAIERLYPDRLAEHIERLAHHAVRGERWEKAVAYLRQTGARAADRSALQDAVNFLEQALAALDRLPESRGHQEQSIDVRLDLRNALEPLGELDRNLDNLREADALAQALGDQRRLGWVFAYRSADSWRRADSAQAAEFAQRALGIARAIDDRVLERYCTHRLANASNTLGDYRRAVELYQRVAESGERLEFGGESLRLSVMVKHWLAWCLAQLGRFQEGVTRAEQTLRIAESIEHPYSLVAGHRAIGFVHLLRGEVEAAIPSLERALDICQTAKLSLLFDGTASALGYAYALAGRLADGISLLGQAVQHPSSTGTSYHSLFLSRLSEAYSMAGRAEEAFAVAERALALSRECGEHGHEAWVLRLLGEIAAHRDPLDAEAAERHYREALALASRLGMRPLVAHCHLGFGKLSRRTGKEEQAREHVTTAATLYREMDMGSYLEQAEAELGPAP